MCASSEVHASARSRRQAARDRALTEYVSDVRDVTATGAEHRALHTDAAMNYAVSVGVGVGAGGLCVEWLVNNTAQHARRERESGGRPPNVPCVCIA